MSSLKLLKGIFIFISCVLSVRGQGGNTTISNTTTNVTDPTLVITANLNYADMSWLIVGGILVMLMTPALGFFYGGLVKTKNMMSMLGQCLTIYCITAVLWTLIGFSLVFSPNTNSGLIGTLENGALLNVTFAPGPYAPTVSNFLYFFYQMQFACITPALIIGGVAERVRFLPVTIFCSIWHILVYCPIAHWNWNMSGWLNLLGTKDFAGGNVIHISSGVAALAIVLYLENEPIRMVAKRKPNAHKHDYEKINPELASENLVNLNFPRNSLVFLVLGAVLLWFGWFGFNAGSAVAVNQKAVLALVNTNIAPAVCILIWVLMDFIYKKRPTVSGMCIAIVCGLVGITPAAGIVRVWAGVIIGVLAAVVPYEFTRIRDKYKFFDDRLDVFGCHGVGGIVGGLCTGLFYCDITWNDTCNPSTGLGAVYGDGFQLLYQVIGIFATIAYSFVMSYLIIYILALIMDISTYDHDDEGVDKIDYSEYALPDTEFYIRNIEKTLDKAKVPPYSSSNSKNNTTSKLIQEIN